MGDEGHLPLVTFLDTNIVVPPSYVKLGEDFGVFEFVNQVRDERWGVCVTDSMGVQVAIVLAGAKSTILFFMKKKGEEAWGDLDGQIFPEWRFLSTKVSAASCSLTKRG